MVQVSKKNEERCQIFKFHSTKQFHVGPLLFLAGEQKFEVTPLSKNANFQYGIRPPSWI